MSEVFFFQPRGKSILKTGKDSFDPVAHIMNLKDKQKINTYFGIVNIFNLDYFIIRLQYFLEMKI